MDGLGFEDGTGTLHIRQAGLEPSAECPSGGHHCAHAEGGGWSYGLGGTHTYRCCNCGEVAQVPYSYESHTVKGHGPHYRQSERVDEWPKGWRPAPPRPPSR